MTRLKSIRNMQFFYFCKNFSKAMFRLKAFSIYTNLKNVENFYKDFKFFDSNYFTYSKKIHKLACFLPKCHI